MAEQKSVVAGRDISTFISPIGTNGRAYYDLFEDFKDITDYSRLVEQELISKNKNWVGRGDYVDNGGSEVPRLSFQGSTDKNLLNNPTQIGTYLYNDVLKRELDNLASLTQNLKLGASAKKNRLEFTEQPTGIFNFGMASKGLYRKREFFCIKLNIVVDENLVENHNGLFFYPTGGEMALCELRQEGTTEMLIKNSNAKILTASDGMIYTDPIRFEDVSLKFATTTKKVYLKKSEIKNLTGGGQEKYVDVYVTPMASAMIRPENLIYSALPSILLAQLLENSGFKVRVNKIIPILDSSGNNLVVYTYPLKEYGDPVNYQRVAIDGADPRIFRWEEFRRWSALMKGALDIDVGGGYGRVASEIQIDTIMNDYKHWLNKEIKRGSGKKIFNKNLNLHLMGTIDKSNDAHDVQMERVLAKLKEMLDKVAIEFSGSEQAIKDAIERDLPKIQKAQIIQNFESSLLKTNPQKPADRDLQLPDNEFQQKLTNYNNNLAKFNQIKTTL